MPRKLLAFALLFALPSLAAAQFLAPVAPVTGIINTSGSSCSKLIIDSTNSGPGACVSMQLPSSAGTASIVLSGTFSATVQFEISADGGNTWIAAAVASSTSAGTSTFTVAGYNGVRARASAYSSGSAFATITVSTASSGGTSPGSACGDSSHALGWTGSAFNCQGITGTAAAGGSVNTLQWNNATALGGISQWTTNGTTTVTESATGILDLHAAPAAGLLLPGALATGAVTVTTSTGAISSAPLPANTTATGSNFLTAYNSATGLFTKGQPACGDLSNAAASCATDATNATNIGSGTLAAGRLPAVAVQTGQVNTYSTGLQSFSAADLLQPVHSADPGTCQPGQIEFNSTGAAMKVCLTTNTWTALGTAAGGDTITSPNSTLGIGGTATNTTLDVLGSAGKILAGATPALTATPTLGANGGTGGSLTLAGSTSGSAAITVSATGVLALPNGTTVTNLVATTPNLGTPSAINLTSGTALPTTRTLSVSFGTPGGTAISTGTLGYVRWPYTCTGQASWSITVDAGTATLKTWKIAAGTAIPTVTNSISTSGVAISTGTNVTSTTVTDFTTHTTTADDIFGVNLGTVSGVGYINFEIVYTGCTQ